MLCSITNGADSNSYRAAGDVTGTPFPRQYSIAVSNKRRARLITAVLPRSLNRNG